VLKIKEYCYDCVDRGCEMDEEGMNHKPNEVVELFKANAIGLLLVIHRRNLDEIGV